METTEAKDQEQDADERAAAASLESEDEASSEESEDEASSEESEDEVSSEESEDEASGASVAERIKAIEPLMALGKWAEIQALLTKKEKPNDLPAQLALFYALAELEADREKSSTEANFMAIDSVAKILDIPKDSPAALHIAKRIMRRNPTHWTKAPAPDARLRIALVVLALVLGIAGGWMLPGGVHFGEVFEAATR